MAIKYLRRRHGPLCNILIGRRDASYRECICGTIGRYSKETAFWKFELTHYLSHASTPDSRSHSQPISVVAGCSHRMVIPR
jgi:DNA polymerase IIIc chi subunit